MSNIHETQTDAQGDHSYMQVYTCVSNSFEVNNGFEIFSKHILVMREK